MRRQHMLKSNQEPKNKILNIYLNCQPRSNEPVPVPEPVSTTSSHIFIRNSNKNFSKWRKWGIWRLWGEWVIRNIICDILHICTVNLSILIYLSSKLGMKTATEKISELEISQSNLTFLCSMLHFTKPFFAASISSTFDIPNTSDHIVSFERKQQRLVEFYFNVLLVKIGLNYQNQSLVHKILMK